MTFASIAAWPTVLAMALVCLAFSVAVFAIIRANVEYRRHLQSLTPEERKMFEEDERRDMQLW